MQMLLPANCFILWLQYCWLIVLEFIMEGIQLFTTSGAGIVNFRTGGDCYPLHRHSNPKRLIPRCSALNGTNFLRESRSANGIISCGRVSMFDWGQGSECCAGALMH